MEEKEFLKLINEHDPVKVVCDSNPEFGFKIAFDDGTVIYIGAGDINGQGQMFFKDDGLIHHIGTFPDLE